MKENEIKSDHSDPVQEEYIGNIWGRKNTIYAAIFVLIMFGIALCRYLVIKPDKLIKEDELEQFIK